MDMSSDSLDHEDDDTSRALDEVRLPFARD